MSLIFRHLLPELRSGLRLMEEPLFRHKRLPSLIDMNWMEHQWPPIELRENKTDYFIEVEIPGLKKENMEINIKDDSIELKGKEFVENEQSKTTDIKDGSPVEAEELDVKPKLLYSERCSVDFERSFTFPTKVEANKAKAQFIDGLLKIKVPKLAKDISVHKLEIE